MPPLVPEEKPEPTLTPTTAPDSTEPALTSSRPQTTYTLHCNGYSGSSPASIDKQVIVNIIPRYIEK